MTVTWQVRHTHVHMSINIQSLFDVYTPMHNQVQRIMSHR